MDDRIRILIVDDSAFMRRMIRNVLEQSPDMEVVGTATDGLDALGKAKDLNPDIITLDIEMPNMDGLTALENLQKQGNYAVIMVSSHAQGEKAATIKALELGAFDFISKSQNAFNMRSNEKGLELIEKIRNAFQNRKKSAPDQSGDRRAAPLPEERAKTAHELEYIVAIGISTGGPRALSVIIPKFPADLPAAFVIVQHMPAGFTKSLAQRLDETSDLKVKEAENEDEVKAGCVYIAPGNHHINFKSDGKKTRIVLTDDPPQGGFRPSVDVMLNSVAASNLNRVIAVIMTGMGSDGTKGLKILKEKKQAHVIAQDENTSVVFGMPKAAIESGVVDEVVPLADIPNRIMNYMGVCR